MKLISWKTLLRDGSMLAASLVVTFVAFRNRRLAGRAPAPSPRPGESPALTP